MASVATSSLDELEPASSSSNYTTRNTSRCTTTGSYDVFLSFRGEDTRLGFTDHLYTALGDAGFRTFRDDDELERGECIQPELEKAIQDSRCSVIVFSKNYASSRWCLDELLIILGCKKTSDQVVLPVFYDVDPSEVRKQTGNFAEAFARHEERFKADISSKVDRWRKALKEAADLSGMNLQNQADRHEAKFIKQIVILVEDKLRRTPLSVTPYLVGIESQLESINSWLEDGSSDVGILLICGIPGIGKTTIAKCVYNSNFKRFERRAFLENISSEISEQPNGLVLLQRKLLSILMGREVIIHNVSEGTNKIRDVIRYKRVILVLDDVDHIDTLDAILGMRDWFYPGSKIIITTRQQLKAREAYEMHEVKELDEMSSLQLFCRHAFGQDFPTEHFRQLSKCIVNHCEGHPLAIQTLGHSLSSKSIDYWESAMEKLNDIPDGDILRKLKISYDAIQEDHVQNLFLDITCFFIGEDKDFIVTVLDGCDGFYPKIGIQNLIEKYLITIDEDNRVRMHNLLRDMGREIIRQESPKELGKRSRLWKDKNSYDVLIEKMGEQTVEGIVLHGRNIRSRNSNKDVVLETDAFTKMCRLRLLILSEVELNGSYESFPKRLKWLSCGSYESFPKRLRWLRWCGFTLHSLPSDFFLESLVVLEMPYSNLRRVWKVSKCLPLLKILDLSGSRHLTKTPDFSLLPKLERLILKDCTSLVNVHESIVNLERLLYLDFQNCKKIKNLPNICTLRLLKTLIISGCSNLNNKTLSELRKMKSLEVFYADGTPMNRWLNTIGEVKSLTNKILLPQYLVELSLARCNLSDDDFRPLDLSNLSSLKRLNLCNNQICMLPDFIRSLNGLDLLSFMGCAKLQSVERLPIIKGNLDLEWCDSLEKITFQSASCKPQSINFSPLNLVEFEYWFKIYPIGSIDEEMINILGFGNYLESVQDVNINITSGGIWQKCNGLPIQGIQEHGIFNIFLPGNEIPSGFSRKSRDSLISFILPILPIKKIQGLNIAAVYAVERYLGFVQLGRLRIQVHNNSKGLKWIYWPTFFGYMDDGKDTIWLSHWKFGNQLEGGDEVSVSIFVYSDEIETINFKEWGIHVVYEEQQEEKMSNQHNTTDPSNVGGIICEDWRDLYEVMPGTYFLKGNPFSKVPRYQSWRLWEEFNKRSEDVLKRSMDLLEKGVSEAECERYKQMMKMLLNHSQKMLLYHDNFEDSVAGGEGYTQMLLNYKQKMLLNHDNLQHLTNQGEGASDD